MCWKVSATTLPAVRLWLADLGLPADQHHLLGDAQVPGVQVDVRPLDADRLATAKASVGDEVV
jgi:hypothetical protein